MQRFYTETENNKNKKLVPQQKIIKKNCDLNFYLIIKYVFVQKSIMKIILSSELLFFFIIVNF